MLVSVNGVGVRSNLDNGAAARSPRPLTLELFRRPYDAWSRRLRSLCVDLAQMSCGADDVPASNSRAISATHHDGCPPRHFGRVFGCSSGEAAFFNGKIPRNTAALRGNAP
jgi:hypothetical protein